MCFRPASASRQVECPNCKKKLSSMGGVLPSKCPFCGTELAKRDSE